MAKTVVPINGHILVELLEGDMTTQHNLVVKGEDKEELALMRGRVLDVGVGLVDEAEDDGLIFPIEKGYIVLFKRYSGSTLPYPGVRQRLVEYADIVGVEEGEE